MEKRGQRLDPNDCIGYYCKQQIGSGSYFASNYPIQRGYGLFSNLRRYAMPIMMKAGKYLGKHLLSTCQNVLEDMLQGKSFKEASKYQLRQVGEEIKKDILRKLKGGGGVKRKKQSSHGDRPREKSLARKTCLLICEKIEKCYCTKSELDLFTSSPIQLAIDRSSFVEIHPVASISDNNTIEFLISGLECHISLNDRQISSENNYAYKAYIQSILFHSESSQKNLLSAGLFVKDTAGKFDDVTLTDAGLNKGLRKRWDRVKNVGRPITAIEEPSLTEVSDNRLKVCQKQTKIVQQIWKRWSNNYLSTLQNRNKWYFEKNNVKIHDMVILKEDNLPVCNWPLGRILEVHHGKDNKIRVVL
ncbi:uncharacterized protein TNCV_4098401 [Trichonephila clavipes]|nr:uncharacterized protein TNCV_4098401 [Trichonephila clavipes]